MSNEITNAKESLTARTLRPSLTDDRIGSLVQVSVRTECDADGNSTTTRVEAERAALVRLLVLDGSPHGSLVPATKDPHAALRAAVTRTKQGLSEMVADAVGTANHVQGAGMLWRRLGVDSRGVLSYALVIASPDAETKKWEGEQACTVSVEKTGGAPVVTWADPMSEAMFCTTVADVVTRYDTERALLHSDDVRTFVNRVMRATNAVSVGGMLHLVPKDGDNEIRCAERALILAGYSVLIQPINEAGSVAENVQQGLFSQVARLSRDVRKLVDNGSDDKKRNVRIDTFDDRLDQARELAARADMFGDLIGMATDDIKAAIAETEKLVRNTMREMVLGI